MRSLVRLAWSGLVLASGCDELGEVTADDFQGVCLAQCRNAASGEGCDEAAILGECGAVCEDTSFTVSEACLRAYRALLDCERGQPFTCNGAVEINGVDWPVLVDRVECRDADLLYDTCPEAPYRL